MELEHEPQLNKIIQGGVVRGHVERGHDERTHQDEVQSPSIKWRDIPVPQSDSPPTTAGDRAPSLNPNPDPNPPPPQDKVPSVGSRPSSAQPSRRELMSGMIVDEDKPWATGSGRDYLNEQAPPRPLLSSLGDRVVGDKTSRPRSSAELRSRAHEVCSVPNPNPNPKPNKNPNPHPNFLLSIGHAGGEGHVPR